MSDAGERGPSRTALGVAWMRAAHQHLEHGAILHDPVIAQLLPKAADVIAQHTDRFQSRGARALRSHVALRSRVAEDALERAVGRGVRQYVILGAGLDTFAYRQPPWAASLRIVEVDQPASQEEKRALLAAADVATPANVAFIAVDFERDALDTSLRRAGVDLSQPVFISWLGVTMYLTRDAVEDVLRLVASLPSGSEIIFTFAQPPDEQTEGTLADRAASVGEPWLTYFTPDEVFALLRELGYSTVEIPAVDAIRERYFSAADVTLPPPRRASIARGVV